MAAVLAQTTPQTPQCRAQALWKWHRMPSTTTGYDFSSSQVRPTWGSGSGEVIATGGMVGASTMLYQGCAFCVVGIAMERLGNEGSYDPLPSNPEMG